MSTKTSSGTVLVVGGSQGIGRSIGLAFAGRGANVVVVARRPEPLRELEKQAHERGLQIEGLSADIAESASPRRVVQHVLERYGTVNVLVNAAATTRRKASLTVPAEDFTEGLHLNVTAAFLTSQAAAEAMSAAGGGCIITIGSLNGMKGIPNTAMYSAAKGALVSLTRCLAVEWAPMGIRTNVIVPGFIETENPGKAFRDPALRSWMLDRVPTRSFGRPDDVAAMALFLASDEARYVTGQVMIVDGGASAA